MIGASVLEVPALVPSAMHASSFENMQKCIEKYAPSAAELGRPLRVVDLGSADVNPIKKRRAGDSPPPIFAPLLRRNGLQLRPLAARI